MSGQGMAGEQRDLHARVEAVRERVETTRIHAMVAFEEALQKLQRVRSARQMNAMNVPMLGRFSESSGSLIADARAKAARATCTAA